MRRISANDRSATRREAGRIAAALALACAAPLLAQAPPTGSLIPSATIDDTLDITGEDLAAKQLRTRLAVPVTVNGKGPYRFVVDSGADRSVIGAALARTLALPAEGTVKLHGVAGSAMVDTVRIDTLGLGTSVIDGIIAPALPETFIGAQGLVGIDALADQRLMMDFDKKTIVVQDSRTPARNLPDEIVVTARRRHGQLIITQAHVGNQRVMVLIDSGSEVTTANGALRQKLFRGGRLPKTTPATLIDVTGEHMTVDMATLPDVTIGGLILRDVRVGFGDVAPFALFGLTDEPALLLGTDLLEAFRRVSLDFGRRTVRFQLRR